MKINLKKFGTPEISDSSSSEFTEFSSVPICFCAPSKSKPNVCVAKSNIEICEADVVCCGSLFPVLPLCVEVDGKGDELSDELLLPICPIEADELSEMGGERESVKLLLVAGVMCVDCVCSSDSVG